MTDNKSKVRSVGCIGSFSYRVLTLGDRDEITDRLRIGRVTQRSTRRISCEAGWPGSSEAIVGDIDVTERRQNKRVVDSDAICKRSLSEWNDCSA